MDKAIVKCGNCGTIINESPSVPLDERNPCQKCKSLKRDISITLVDQVKIDEGLNIKRRNSNGKVDLEYKNRKRYSFDHKKMADWFMLIDRRDDNYHEKYTDPDTSEVFHEGHEPLSKHQGHGSAKKKIIKKNTNRAPD